MTENRSDDVYFVCTMIEFVARATKNHRKDVVSHFTAEDLEKEIQSAGVNHCLSFEQVCDEWINAYKIPLGDFDSVSSCRYTVPPVTSIGRVYQRLVLASSEKGGEARGIIEVFSSFISDEISNFNSSTYYSNPDYLKCSYDAGQLLD